MRFASLPSSLGWMAVRWQFCLLVGKGAKLGAKSAALAAPAAVTHSEKSSHAGGGKHLTAPQLGQLGQRADVEPTPGAQRSSQVGS